MNLMKTLNMCYEREVMNTDWNILNGSGLLSMLSE